MKILLFGSRGQLGQALSQALNDLYKLHLSHRGDCDLTVTSQIEILINSVKPDLIINSAAYTNVDAAESNQAETFAINAKAPEIMAKKASILGIPLIHFSTDYVFDGLKEYKYIESDLENPQSQYAKTKYLGEEAIRKYLPEHIILRTSWIYSHHHQKNFVYKIINQLSQDKFFNVVNDEWGSPTPANFIAQSILKIIPYLKDKVFGTYHLTSLGKTTRYSCASFIEKELIRLGKIEALQSKRVSPILSIQYQLIAKRPTHAILNCAKIKRTFVLEFKTWQDELSHFLCESFPKGL